MIDVPASTQLLTKMSFAITLITSVIIYLIIAFSISAPVMVATLLVGVLSFALLRPLMERINQRSRSRTILYRDTMHHVAEHVGGLKTVKSFGVEQEAIAAQAMAPIGIIYIATILSLSFKTPFISFAALPAILYLIYRIFTYIQQLQNTLQYTSEVGPHLERVVQLGEDAGAGAESEGGDRPFSFQHELSFKKVSFAYEDGRDV